MRIKWYKTRLNVKPLLQIIEHVKLYFKVSLIHLVMERIPTGLWDFMNIFLYQGRQNLFNAYYVD